MHSDVVDFCEKSGAKVSADLSCCYKTPRHIEGGSRVVQKNFEADDSLVLQNLRELEEDSESDLELEFEDAESTFELDTNSTIDNLGISSESKEKIRESAFLDEFVKNVLGKYEDLWKEAIASNLVTSSRISSFMGKVHQHTISELKKLVEQGLPSVPYVAALQLCHALRDEMIKAKSTNSKKPFQQKIKISQSHHGNIRYLAGRSLYKARTALQKYRSDNAMSQTKRVQKQVDKADIKLHHLDFLCAFKDQLEKREVSTQHGRD